MSEFVVPERFDGLRLDSVLAALLDVSRSQAARIVDDGRVDVGGSVARRSLKVATGDRIVVRDTDVTVETGGGGRPLPPIRYRDDHVLVVAKPPDLVVHPGPGHAAGTLVQILADAGLPLAPSGGEGRPGIVHRLDKDTSGLMVVACTDLARDHLVEALRAREVERRYVALVEGRPPALRGRVDAPIGRDPSNRQRFAAVPDGKHAITHWRVAEEVPGHTLLTCRLETGRTHQIRVHMAHAGCPVAGDTTYGASAGHARRIGLSRPFLHAGHLAFTHPVTGERLAFDEPLPDDLDQVARGLGLAAAPPPEW